MQIASVGNLSPVVHNRSLPQSPQHMIRKSKIAKIGALSPSTLSRRRKTQHQQQERYPNGGQPPEPKPRNLTLYKAPSGQQLSPGESTQKTAFFEPIELDLDPSKQQILFNLAGANMPPLETDLNGMDGGLQTSMRVLMNSQDKTG